MSIERQVQIYTYTLNILNLTLKIKFPCKIYLQHQGKAITTQVGTTSPNKFIFNQQVTLKNETQRDYIEVIVQLVTEKGAKYVGGVLKFVENQLIGSEGERIVVSISKCLDTEAYCEVRIDQVATSRVARRESPKKRALLKSEYQPEINVLWSNSKNKMTNQGETKSEYNFPLSVNRNKDRYDMRQKEPTLGPSGTRKQQNRISEIGGIDKEPTMSMAGGVGMSPLQFEVYKEGYNKLKEKYRKQAETARSQLNKRMTLQSNENNLKLQLMRYKLKTEELEKSIADKNNKIKELTEAVSNFQKKELDTKYFKEEVDNKTYTIKNLEETIKTLMRDNGELKNLQNLKSQSEQEAIRNLKEQIEKIKREMENREAELLRDLKSRNQIISKKDYEMHVKSEELERAKCAIEDLQKAISNKTFEWERVQQNDRTTAKTKHDELREKINKLQTDKTAFEQRIKDLEQSIEEKRGEIIRIQYDKKVVIQNNESLQKENEDLRNMKEKYIELVREHKLQGEEKHQLQKSKEREGRLKDTQIEELSQRLQATSQGSKKTVKQLEEKLKANQMKLIENESQNELLRNQLEKAKRQNDILTKEFNDLKNQLKQAKTEAKQKEERLLSLTNELTDSKNRSKQGDYSSKVEVDRLKQDVEKYTKSLEEERSKVTESLETINKLQLEGSKLKMEWQFREEKALKELGYAKEKITSLENFRADLQNQISTANLTITNLKSSEKSLNEKIQKMELQAIKSRQLLEKSRKEGKVLEQKLQNSENSIKSKVKELTEQLEHRESLEKKISDNESEISQLRNDLSKEINEKIRNQKIVEILQIDLAKGKQQQTRLTSTISVREKSEQQLRDELKKQKEEYTKLDMRLSALKKEYEKFKDTLVDNIQSVFSSIPDGANSSPVRQSKMVLNEDKSKTKQNSDILNMLTTLGKETRSSTAKLVEQLKASQRQHEKLNSEYSTTINKCNTTEFEFNQNIFRLEQEISELLADKQNIQNKYEEEVFLLEGRIRQKESVISDLSQQIEELDFTYKNTRGELDAFRDDSAKKDINRNKLIGELREQIQYHINEINLYESNIERMQEDLEAAHAELDDKVDRLNKIDKELFEARESLQVLQEENGTLRRQLKKANQKNEELSLELISEKEEIEKLRASVEEQERKAGELRQFLSGLMKQKEQIIKKELEKSEQILEFETKMEEFKHENEWLNEELKKYKKIEEESKQLIKKQTKSLKEEEIAKNEEKTKNSKLNDKLKEKEKQLAAKDQNIAKLEEKLKREKEKLGKDVKQLETELDETYLKLLNKEKESSEKINLLESQNERLKLECQKLKEDISSSEEALLNEKNKAEDLTEELASSEKKLAEAQQKIKSLEEKEKELETQINSKEEESFRLQGKIYGLEGRLEQKESEKNDKLQNLNSDWSSKYDSMCQEYEQRLELIEKEKDFLKERVEQKERQVKKQNNEVKMQQNNINILKKSFEEKIKSLESDRLTVFAQKNTENQRLIEEGRVNFQNLKAKQSECRKLSSELELSKASANKLDAKLKESEEKIRSLNRTYLTEVEDMKKKQQNFKRVKQNVVSSIWKSEREVRRIIQASIKKIIEVVDEQSTIKVMEVTKALQQNVVSAITIKIDEKDQ